MQIRFAALFCDQLMKTLYILRHAKSSWDAPATADFDRPLNERGKRAAPFVGELMRERGFLPEIILCSPAVRARQTATLVKQSAELAAEIRFADKIYEASPIRLMKIAAEIDENFQSAMLVGHNPGLEGLITTLTGKTESLPTAALAIVDLDGDLWSEIDSPRGRLRLVIRPRDEMNSGGAN